MLDIAQLLAAAKPKGKRQADRFERVLVPAPRPVSRADGPPLPGQAQAIAEVIGREQTCHLVGQLPRFASGSAGRKSMQPMLHIPKRITRDHLLARILGWDDAQALVGALGGETIKLSTCREVYLAFRDRAIVDLLGEGNTQRMVADIVGVSERWVREMARKAG